ncbi:hypothetical protein IW262DRAFT_1317667 [Armillaria fumosa]|nr:hypothetical protein IW262DRAFT_1317667 [Armillaria fumosa]
MANIIRSAKPGSRWTTNELEAYNIVIKEQNENTFFEKPLPAYHGPADFLQHEHATVRLDAASNSLLKRLDLAADVVEGEESAVNDFVAELLRILGYERQDTVVRTRKNIRFLMCGEYVHATTDACLLDAESLVLLLVQEDKSHINPMDPESQLIAEAIAAFQENNKRRTRLFLEPLPVQIIPGITMIGTFPTFYKIAVTSELDQCIRQGQYPATQTVVYRHTPRVPRRRNEGMRPLPSRELLIRCYEAFKHIVLQDEDEANEANQNV